MELDIAGAGVLSRGFMNWRKGPATGHDSPNAAHRQQPDHPVARGRKARPFVHAGILSKQRIPSSIPSTRPALDGSFALRARSRGHGLMRSPSRHARTLPEAWTEHEPKLRMSLTSRLTKLRTPEVGWKADDPSRGLRPRVRGHARSTCAQDVRSQFLSRGAASLEPASVHYEFAQFAAERR